MWQVRTLGIFTLLSLILIGIGYVVGYFVHNMYIGMAIMAAVSVLICFYSYWFCKKSALRANRVHLITESEDPRLYNIVKSVAQKAGLPMPEVGISEFDMPNAFATGRNPKDAAVVATRGLLNLLNDEELEGVIGHEMSHVKNRDILVMSVASTLVSVLTYASRMVFYSMLFGGGDRRDENNGAMLAIGLVCCIFVPIAALLLQLAVSRSREYLADETGARITGKPLQLANALMRLEGGCARPNNNYSDTAHANMWISNPVRKGAFKSLFSTHPATEERIRRLRVLSEKMGDGQVPAYVPEEDSSRSKLRFQ